MELGVGKGTGTGPGTGTNTEGNSSRTVAGISGKNRKNKLDLESGNQFFDSRIAREFSVSLESVRWLTTSEAAQYLRISTSSIKTMIYRGQVRAHKLGRRNRFLKEELERLIVLPNSK